MNFLRRDLMDSKRVVVKVGTSSLTYDNGRLRLQQIERLVREISDLVNAGHQLILVSSGAIGAGMSQLGLTKRPKSIPKKQATAAVGQGLLMQVYSKLFSEYGHICAQVLLTTEDLEHRKRYLNCRNTFETLLHQSVIPIVNENDSVSIDEIKFGDNDTLSSMVATLVSADLLVILSDIDGVYDRDPKLDHEAKLIPVIEGVTERDFEFKQNSSVLGTGGIKTKINAAKICCMAGIPLIIANTQKPGVIRKAICNQPIGTFFVPEKVCLPSRKRWLAVYSHPHGELVIDTGAEHALHSGKSLLSAGILSCSGNFTAGDLVVIANNTNKAIAKGLVNYSAAELDLIKGKTSSEIAEVLVDFQYDEVVHRDNLVMLTSYEEESYGSNKES